MKESTQELLIEKPSSGADVSPDGRYRYMLWRQWGHRPSVLWIMLNPSTAGVERDDPTIRRCTAFAKRWECDGIVVANLFAMRATNPKELRGGLDPCGHRNQHVLEQLLKYGVHQHRVVAWGAGGGKFARRQADRFWEWFGRFGFTCLGETRDGEPRHPLYLPADARLRPYLRKGQ